MSFATFEREGWDRKAEGYGRMLGRITDRLTVALLDAAGGAAHGRVLDVGCGHGAATAAAAARGAVAVGVDVSPEMLRRARADHSGPAYLIGSAEALPLRFGTCAAVVGNFLVHHLADPHRAVREFRRVLSGDGRVALTAWDLPDNGRLVGVLLDAIAETGVGIPAGLPEAPSFFRFSADGALADLLRECGFTDVATERVAFEHAVAGTDEWWHGLLHGTVRMSALVTGQSVADQRRIRAAFDRIAAGHAQDGSLKIPVSVRLAAGRVPSRSASH
jgi:SAM-dependent methyltransferase